MAVYPITEPPGRLGVITAYLMIYVVWGSTYYFMGLIYLTSVSPYAIN